MKMTLGSYEKIKKLAKELGCSAKDLLVLSQARDPFYGGKGAGRRRNGLPQSGSEKDLSGYSFETDTLPSCKQRRHHESRRHAIREYPQVLDVSDRSGLS